MSFQPLNFHNYIIIQNNLIYIPPNIEEPITFSPPGSPDHSPINKKALLKLMVDNASTLPESEEINKAHLKMVQKISESCSNEKEESPLLCKENITLNL